MLFSEFLNESSFRFEYHDKLNPKIWDKNRLKSKVVAKLKRIANEFYDFLEVSSDYHVMDVIFTGSLANYNYTMYSDIDLHIIIDKTPDHADKVGLDLVDIFDTKKKLWGEEHDITIFGYPVEIYVQLQDEVLTASGVYSIKDNKWNVTPKHLPNIESKVNNYVVNVKSKEIKKLIDSLMDSESDDVYEIRKIKTKIKEMRQSGLKKSGEFAIENLVFKDLRNTGYLEKLQKLKVNAVDKSLSLF